MHLVVQSGLQVVVHSVVAVSVHCLSHVVSS